MFWCSLQLLLMSHNFLLNYISLVDAFSISLYLSQRTQKNPRQNRTFTVKNILDDLTFSVQISVKKCQSFIHVVQQNMLS